METIRFETNIPQVLALAFAEGKPVESKFGGDQVMFSTVDNRRFFVAPFVADKIKAAGIPARTEFAICKREVVHGNRRSVEFQIEKANGSDANEAWEELGAGAPVKNTPAAAPVSQLKPLVKEQVQSNNAPTESALMRCYREAIDLAIGVTQVAKERGLLVTPGFDDIRAIAATLYISESKGGR